MCVHDSKPVLRSPHLNPSKLFRRTEAFSSLCGKEETCPSVTCLWLKHFCHLSQAGPSQGQGLLLYPCWRAFWLHHWLLALTKVSSDSSSSGCHCAEVGVAGRAMSFNLLTSICQFGSFLADRWRRACLVRWSLLMNRRSHIGQANFFSPVWVRRCLDSSSERANLLSQPFQLQLKGFSPVCVLTWAFRWELLK